MRLLYHESVGEAFEGQPGRMPGKPCQNTPTCRAAVSDPMRPAFHDTVVLAGRCKRGDCAGQTGSKLAKILGRVTDSGRGREVIRTVASKVASSDGWRFREWLLRTGAEEGVTLHCECERKGPAPNRYDGAWECAASRNHSTCGRLTLTLSRCGQDVRSRFTTAGRGRSRLQCVVRPDRPWHTFPARHIPAVHV